MRSGEPPARPYSHVLIVFLLGWVFCAQEPDAAFGQRHRPAATPKPTNSPGMQLRILGESQVFTGSPPIANAPANRRVLFQSCRYGRDFRYVLENLPPHNQLRIELGFAELFAEAPGERLMQIEINGQILRDNFDVVAESGGARRALVVHHQLGPSTHLELRFVGKKGDAFVNFVRVEGLGQEIVIGPGAARLLQPENVAGYDLTRGEIRVQDGYAAPPYAMPLGGIGTGSLELLADGTFSNITIGNSWAEAIRGLRGCFLAVRAKHRSFSGEGRILVVGKGAPSFENAKPMLASRYCAHYPFCELEFEDPTFPLEVSVEAFAPCVSYDLLASSLPVVVISVNVRNPNLYPVASAVALSWENMIGRGTIGVPPQTFPQSRTVAHNDAGTGELVGVHLSSLEPPLGPRTTFIGDQFVGTVTTGVVVSRLLNWDPSTATIPWWKEFIRSGRVARRPQNPEFWSTSQAREGNCAAVVTAAFNLGPKESRRIPFFIAWYYPHFVDADGTMHTNAYADRFASSVGAAFYVLSRLDWLVSESRAWGDSLFDSDFPGWLVQSLLDGAASSAANSVWWKGEAVRWLATRDNGALSFTNVELDPLVRAWADCFFPELDTDSWKLTLGDLKTENSASQRGPMQGSLRSGTRLTIESLAAITAKARRCADLDDDTSGVHKKFIHVIESAFEGDTLQSQLAKPGCEATFFADWPSTVTADLRPYKALYAAAVSKFLEELWTAEGERSRALRWRREVNEWDRLARTMFASIERGWISEEGHGPPSFAAYFAADWLSRTTSGQGLANDSLTSVIQMVVARHLPVDTIVPLEVPTTGGAFTAPGLLNSWFAAEAIGAGLPNAGLELAARLAQLRTAPYRNPWGMALFYEEATAQPAAELNHSVAASVWSIAQAIVGVHYDRRLERLIVLPRLPFELGDHVVLPVFTPHFHGRLDFDAQEHEWTLTILRTAAPPNGSALQVRKLIVPDPDYAGARREIDLTKPLLLRPGYALHYYSGRCEEEPSSR